VAQRGQGAAHARLGAAIHARRGARPHDRLVQGIPLTGILDQDLDAVLDRTRSIWTELNGARVLLTGATGFVGTHMLESVRHARERTGADVRVVAPARNPAKLHDRLPWTKNAAWLEVPRGDVREFVMPAGAVDLVIHSANTASPAAIGADPEGIARMVVEGSTRIHELAAMAGARRMLQVSSGSVSGAHFTPSRPIAEDDPGVPLGETPGAHLARAKGDAEQALLEAAKQRGPEIVFVRGFALAGPWLPLDSDFAFGNFVGAALRGGPIVVSGDGTPVRSYLYSGDMVAWLWAMLLRGVNGRPYNVGSSHAVTIGQLAHRIATLVGGAVQVNGTPAAGAPAHWHVPDTTRVRAELGLAETVSLDDAIVRTARWWSERGARAGTSGSAAAPS
jgi:dTDP-glucose 4,6-dehydratase